MSILKDLERVLLSEIAVDLNRKSLTPEEDLLEQGIIDSLGIMKLILYMEDTFGIVIADEDVVPENFQCLNSMVKYVEAKMQK
jgi:acyl carrier protein